MTKTRKYLIATLVGCYGLILLFVVAGRVVGEMAPDLAAKPIRNTPAELVSLADFNEIRAVGDFSIDVSSGEKYSVEFFPIDQGHGNLRAKVQDDVLWLEGVGNRRGDQTDLVRIVMPELRGVRANGLAKVSIRGMREPNLLIHLYFVYRLDLANSEIDALTLDAKNSDEIHFVDLKTQARQINVSGSAQHEHTRIYDQ